MPTRRDFIKMSGCLLCAGALGTTGCQEKVDAGMTINEASYYESSGGVVRCTLCPHYCSLPSGAYGVCRARQNVDGKLISQVYGKPVSIHLDPVEKKPFYHFLPGSRSFSLATTGCNLRCSFCQNWEISQASPDSIPSYEGSPVIIAEKAKNMKAATISCTYTEPIVFIEYTKDIAAEAKKMGVRTIIISAGYINQKPLLDLCKVSSGIKIDLKSFNDKFYQELTGGRLKPVLDALVTIKNSGVWLEIVNLLIPGKNDSLDEISKMCQWIKSNLGADVPLHFTRFFPLYKLNNLPPTPVRTLEQARKTGLDEGLHYVYVGNMPGHTGNHTYCPKCGKTVIERIGFTVKTTGLKNGKCASCERSIAGVWS